MRIKFLYFGILFLTLCALVSFTDKQGIDKQEADKQVTVDFTTEVYSRFYSFLDYSKQEKLYLHTDKPYYSAGENLWFKGYLVNAATLSPDTLSGFIYVELFNRADSLVSRVKVSESLTGFAGHIELDQTLPTGEYSLRAYTNWMQNNSTDFFFTKNIYIGNRIEELVDIKTTYGPVEDGQVLVDVRFVDEYMNPISEKKVDVSGEFTSSRQRRKRKISLTTNSEGKISFDLPVDTVSNLVRVLDLSLDMGSFSFESKLFIPDFSNDFDVQFFPESGVFLNHGLQTIAFKAIGTDGLSSEVSGRLYTGNDKNLSEIKTVFNGMGKFMINAVPDESYYVILKSNKGIEKRFELPKMEDEGVSLRVNLRENKIFYSINNQLADQSIPLYLLLHSNGNPLIVSPVNKLVGQISGDISNSGIYTLSIIDSLSNVYCERLFFRNTPSPLITTMETDKESYGKRELVNLSFNVQSEIGTTKEGLFSLSVTDSRFVKPDTINDDIVSYLLLSSDLKGYIEHPTSYFTNDSITNHWNLELLMLSQGWRRYNTADLLKDNIKKGDYNIETSQTLSGKVVNIFGKPVKNCDIFGLVDTHILETKTNDEGQYSFDDIGFMDSTTFKIRAQRKKLFIDVRIVPNLEVFPAPKNLFLTRRLDQQNIPNDYFDQSKIKFFSEGGMRHIYLDEFTVEAKKKPKSSGSFFAGMADNTVESKDLERMSGWSISTILGSIPGVFVTGNQISIRNNPPPLIIVDGVRSGDASDLDFIIPSDLENIQVFKGAMASIFGPGSGNGVIVFTTKRGELKAPEPPLSMATITPLGLQRPEAFYVPKYDVKSNLENGTADLRTTVYWDPYLSSDSTGVVNVSFYTADPTNDYLVVLEGVTIAGDVCRYEGTIKRD